MVGHRAKPRHDKNHVNMFVYRLYYRFRLSLDLISWPIDDPQVFAVFFFVPGRAGLPAPNISFALYHPKRHTGFGQDSIISECIDEQQGATSNVTRLVLSTDLQPTITRTNIGAISHRTCPQCAGNLVTATFCTMRAFSSWRNSTCAASSIRSRGLII